MDSTYLGDGLYFSYDGYHIRLYAERDGRIHEVFLEDHVLMTFLMVVGKALNKNIKMEDQNE